MSAKHRARLLYLDTAPTVGGSVVSLYELLKGLDSESYEPLVVSYAPHAFVDRFRALGVEVIEWPMYGAADHRPGWIGGARGSSLIRGLRRSAKGEATYHGVGFGLYLLRRVWPRARAIARIIREKHIALTHTNIRLGHDREGVLAARLAAVPCVCHVRDFEQLTGFDRWLAGGVASFLYISQAVQRSHMASGVPCEKGRVVYNGLDLAAFDAGMDAARGRKGLGLSNDDPTVGVVGRLESWKGQEVFLRAMAQVRVAVPQARGIVVGDPVPYEPGYRDRLLSLRQELGLSDCVAFHDFRPDVPALMSAIDVLVLPSTSPEPFGRVLIEAMAAGKPVVATDAGATGEVIDNGEQGLLVPANDAQAMGDAVTRLLLDPCLAKAMGQKGRHRVEARFTARHYVDGVQAVYREVLARGSTNA